jgi:hypothetical protein
VSDLSSSTLIQELTAKRGYKPNPKRPMDAYITTPKTRKINKLYHRLPNVREITLEGCLGDVTPAVFRMFYDYIRNAKQLQSLDIDFVSHR